MCAAKLVMSLLAFVSMSDAVAGCNVSHVERLSRRSECGDLAVRAEGKRLRREATASVKRVCAESAKRRLADGLKQRCFSGKGATSSKWGLMCGDASKETKILVMYDVSIDEGSKKWQPCAGDSDAGSAYGRKCLKNSLNNRKRKRNV